MQRLKSLRHNAPLAVGIGIGWWLLWNQGMAFVLSEDFYGYGWPGYVINAWSVVHDTDAGYDSFRQPLHAWLLGTLGEQLSSYPHAAILLSSASMFGMVVATGLIAAFLAGPWAGGLAAATLPMVIETALAARAANHYPLQGSLAALGVAVALWATPRRASVWRAALAGLVAGLAVAVDGRMIFFAVVAAGVLLLQRPLRLLAFASLFWVGPQWGDSVRLETQPAIDVQTLLIRQRPVLLRWAQSSNDPALMADCQREPPNVLPSLEGLQTPCAQSMWRYNRDKKIPEHVPFGIPLTTLAFAIVLVPLGLRSWRKNLLGSVWMLGAGLPLALQALWVPYPDRYILPWAPFLATIVPIGLAKLRPAMLLPLMTIGAGLWVWHADPSGRTQQGHHINRVYQARREAPQVVAPLIGDDPFLDCSGLFISVSLLPRITSDPPQFKTNTPNDQRCDDWIAAPPPQAWLATNSRDGTGQQAQAAGWTRVYMSMSLQVWRHP